MNQLAIFSLVPGWLYAALLAAALALGGVQTVRLARANTKAVQVSAAAAKATADLITASRAIERTQATAVEKAASNARAQITIARRDAVAARAAADSLRSAADLAAAGACDPGAAGGGDAARAPAHVLADVLQRADGIAGDLAASLDTARAAGQACQAAYNALSGAK